MRWATKTLGTSVAVAVLLIATAAHCDDSFEHALSLASDKRYSDARVVLDPLLEREPGHPRARLLDGILLTRTGQLDDAVAVFEALRRDRPDMIEPYNNLAVIYAVQSRLDDARMILLEILERHPDAVVYDNLGDVYTKLARHAYQRARELDPGGGVLRQFTKNTSFTLPPGHSAATHRQQPAPGSSDKVMRLRNAASGAPDSVPEHAYDGERAADAPTVPPATLSAFAPICTHAGGFGSRRDVAEAALWLQSSGVEVLEVRHEERRIVESYRVYLPPFASRERAAAMLREIRARGVRDVGLIADGSLENGISFGIFRNSDNLHRRVAALGDLGFAVRSVPEDVRIVEDYVISARAGGAPAALEAAWGARFPGVPIQVVDCG